VDETDLRHVHELFVVLSLAALAFLLNASTATARYSPRRVVLSSTSICTRTQIPGGSRVYGSGGGPALNVYQSVTAGKSPATMATWYVDDIDQVVDELTTAGVEFARYDEFDHDARGITARAGGGRIAWFRDPDGNTFALEADA
jgi:catechol 2,3-dioxygenase-like lactoylglutathione lyase family enzyme